MHTRENNEEHSQGVTLMTGGSVRRQIVRFALPVFWGNLFQQLYNIVDSLVVGNFLGSDALAAVGSSGHIIFLLVGLFSGLFTGASVVISGYFGAQEHQKMHTAIHTTVAFGLLAGVVLSVVGVAVSPTLLRWIGTPDSVFANSALYFRIYFSGVVFVTLYNTATGILQAVGDSRHPLYYLIISSVTNVVLDLLFVAVFHMGVDGAALAKVLHMGIPAGLQNSIISIGNIFVQSGINLFGATAIAGAGAYLKIEGFGFLPINAFVLALTTFVSQNLGAKEYGRAKEGARFGVISCMVMAEGVALLIYLLAPQLLSLFGGDPDMIAFGIRYARTVTPFYFLMAFSHAVASVLRGTGKAVVPMVVIAVCWCLVRVIYISLFSASFTDLRQVVFVYPITWLLSTLVFVIFRSDGSRSRRLLLRPLSQQNPDKHHAAARVFAGCHFIPQNQPAAQHRKHAFQAQDQGGYGGVGILLTHDLQGVADAAAHHARVDDGRPAAGDFRQRGLLRDQRHGQTDHCRHGELNAAQLHAVGTGADPVNDKNMGGKRHGAQKQRAVAALQRQRRARLHAQKVKPRHA